MHHNEVMTAQYFSYCSTSILLIYGLNLYTKLKHASRYMLALQINSLLCIQVREEERRGMQIHLAKNCNITKKVMNTKQIQCVMENSLKTCLCPREDLDPTTSCVCQHLSAIKLNSGKTCITMYIYMLFKCFQPCSRSRDFTCIPSKKQ